MDQSLKLSFLNLFTHPPNFLQNCWSCSHDSSNCHFLKQWGSLQNTLMQSDAVHKKWDSTTFTAGTAWWWSCIRQAQRKWWRKGSRPGLLVVMRHKTGLSWFVFYFNQDSSRCSTLAVSNTALRRLKVLWVVTEVIDISLFPFCYWQWFSAVLAQFPNSLAFNRLVLFTGLPVPGAACFTIKPVHEKAGGRNK